VLVNALVSVDCTLELIPVGVGSLPELSETRTACENLDVGHSIGV